MPTQPQGQPTHRFEAREEMGRKPDMPSLLDNGFRRKDGFRDHDPRRGLVGSIWKSLPQGNVIDHQYSLRTNPAQSYDGRYRFRAFIVWAWTVQFFTSWVSGGANKDLLGSVIKAPTGAFISGSPLL